MPGLLPLCLDLPHMLISKQFSGWALSSLLNELQGERQLSSFTLHSVCSMPLLKTLLIYKICFWYPCWKSGNSIYFLEFISGSSLIFHWSTRLFLCSTMPSLSLWFWSTNWGQLFWFLHHFSPWLGFLLAIESVLYFHMNFQIFFPLVLWTCYWNPPVTCVEELKGNLRLNRTTALKAM